MRLEIAIVAPWIAWALSWPVSSRWSNRTEKRTGPGVGIERYALVRHPICVALPLALLATIAAKGAVPGNA